MINNIQLIENHAASIVHVDLESGIHDADQHFHRYFCKKKIQNFKKKIQWNQATVTTFTTDLGADYAGGGENLT